MKRTKRRRRALQQNGKMLMWMAGREAFRDAWYDIMLEQWERFLRDPNRREKFGKAVRELLVDILKDLPD